MSSRKVLSMTTLALLCALPLFVIGCGQKQIPPDAAQTSTTKETQGPRAEAPASSNTATAAGNSSAKATPSDTDHGHKPGSHGGIIVPIGTDSYHAEAVIENGGKLRLITLGSDESRLQEVQVQAIKAYVKVLGQSDAIPVDLTASPQDGDTPGQTSQFVGELPQEFRGKSLEVTIPNLRINGERFRIGFTTQKTVHEEEMRDSLPTAEEQALYLTPGGKYTEADIEANGKTTASQKFKGVMSSHDMKPQSGDRICPVTLTKANPAFTWIIDGKSYQFCCPPCVDEFVETAKFQPEKIKAPDSYIK